MNVWGHQSVQLQLSCSQALHTFWFLLLKIWIVAGFFGVENQGSMLLMFSSILLSAVFLCVALELHHLGCPMSIVVLRTEYLWLFLHQYPGILHRHPCQVGSAKCWLNQCWASWWGTLKESACNVLCVALFPLQAASLEARLCWPEMGAILRSCLSLVLKYSPVCLPEEWVWEKEWKLFCSFCVERIKVKS